MGKPQPVSTVPLADHQELALVRWFGDLADRGILVTDEQLVIRGWNPWLVMHTGIGASEAIGRPLLDVCPSIAARGLDEFFRDALAGEVRVLSQRLHKYLIPVVRSVVEPGTGEPAQSARIAPLTSDNRVVGTVTIIEDVSERVATERELRAQIIVSERARTIAEDASRLKDEFLATLSHEIRTPLNAVLGWARILRTQQPDRSPDRGLEVIERNAIAQLRLVEDLLDMARVMSGKLRLEVAPVSARDVMQAAIDVIEPAAAARDISIHTSFDDARLTVNADADRLQQAFWNVLANAVKFTPEGGRIHVSIVKAKDAIDVVVNDNGQGIGHDFLPYVFDRFRQADASPARRYGGLGLGLALVRHIVELHGGRVSVQSAGVDQGSSFLLQLPTADVMTIPAPVASSAFPGGPIALDGITILLLDDSADGREMLEVALRGYGADVVALDSSERAVGLLAEGKIRPDIIISDIGMPGIDGYEFIRRVRALPETVRRVPAIAVSAYANPEERIKALVAGYQNHLAKPVDPALVGDSVRRLFSATRRR